LLCGTAPYYGTGARTEARIRTLVRIRISILKLGTASFLKVPKRENFLLAFFALSEPIWACDVRTAEKIKKFYQLTADFDVFWFFAAY
jgi:hypothetical protein